MSDNQPAFRVYSVIPRGEGKDDYWLNIGLAFPHQDGKGFNIMLQALPLNAKLVLREPAADEQGGKQDQQANDRRETDNSRRDYRSQASTGRPGGRR
jgi:hypothetical protein